MPTIADLKVEHCDSCRAPIYWLRNDNTGRPAPIDARQDPAGPIIIRADGGNLLYHVLTKVELNVGLGQGVTRYTNHFMTCRHAKLHRKGS